MTHHGARATAVFRVDAKEPCVAARRRGHWTALCGAKHVSFPGLPNEPLQAEWLKTTEAYFLTVLEVGTPNRSALGAVLPPKALEEPSVLLQLRWLLVLLGLQTRHSHLCLCLCPDLPVLLL